MEISKALNLVCPVETDNGTVYIHSMPIRRETFKDHFLILSKTLNQIYAEGISQVTGPRVAALMLQKIAIADGTWDTEGKRIGVKDGLMNEIRRLSNAVLATESGWKTIPLIDAVSQKYLTEEDIEEAEGYIVFFTCISHLHKKKEIPQFLTHMGTLWDTQNTSLTCTEFADSLPTSTTEETFLPTVPASSIPV